MQAVLLLMLAAIPPSQPTSVVILPLQAGAGVTRALADQVTSLLAVETSRRKELRVLTIKDQPTCGSPRCWADLATSLKTDELIHGSLVRHGERYLLTLERFLARTSSVATRVSRQTAAPGEAAVLHVIPAASAELFGGTTVEKDPPRPWKSAARVAGGAGMAGSLAVMGALLAALVGYKVVGLWDTINRAKGTPSNLNEPTSLALDLGAMAMGGALLLLIPVFVASAAALAAGVVL